MRFLEVKDGKNVERSGVGFFRRNLFVRGSSDVSMNELGCAPRQQKPATLLPLPASYAPYNSLMLSWKTPSDSSSLEALLQCTRYVQMDVLETLEPKKLLLRGA